MCLYVCLINKCTKFRTQNESNSYGRIVLLTKIIEMPNISERVLKGQIRSEGVELGIDFGKTKNVPQFLSCNVYQIRLMLLLKKNEN